jgi:hypothetical protein
LQTEVLACLKGKRGFVRKEEYEIADIFGIVSFIFQMMRKEVGKKLERNRV